MQELRILDADAGMRILCKYQGRQCFGFVTRSLKGYVMMIYSFKVAGKRRVPDRRLVVREFGDEERLESFLARVVARPVKAYAY